MKPDKDWTEAEVRALRDKVYGHQTSGEWESVKADWMKPENIRWLLEHQHEPGKKR